jgi:hypothetical protein
MHYLKIIYLKVPPPHIEKPSFTEHCQMFGSSGQHCCGVLLVFRGHLRQVLVQNAYLKISTRSWATSCHLSPWILLRNPNVQHRSSFAQSLNHFLTPLTQYLVVCPEIQHRELQRPTDSFPKIRLSYHYYMSWSFQTVAHVQLLGLRGWRVGR